MAGVGTGLTGAVVGKDWEDLMYTLGHLVQGY